MHDRLGQGAVSEPEPTDGELRRDKLAEEYARQMREAATRAGRQFGKTGMTLDYLGAKIEDARREKFTRFMRQTIKPILVDATDEETAEEWMDRIWEEVRR